MAPFRVARLRIDRAVSQGKALAQLWNAIPAEDVFKIKPRVTHDGWGSIRVEEIKRISGEYPLLLGEMLYQLRSALDACIYQATIYGKPKLSEKEERSLEFPITNDPTEFPKLAKRRLWGLPSNLQDAIEQLQPYHPPTEPPDQIVFNLNRSLGILNELARKDRHRTLHVIGSWPVKNDPLFDLPPGVTLEYVKIAEPAILEEFVELATFQLRGYKSGMQIRANPNLTTQIGLNELPRPCHPNDTFDMRLTEMINAAHSVISIFEDYNF
jgi:hypothetical protein